MAGSTSPPRPHGSRLAGCTHAPLPAHRGMTVRPRRTDAAIRLDHVSRWYGDVVAVNDISFEVSPGVTGLLGPNGAGKTTLLHMTAGLLAPSAGQVLVQRRADLAQRADVPPRGPGAGTRDRLSRTSPGASSPSPTRASRACLMRSGQPTRAIDLVDLADAADRRIATYSKGMRQRIKMAAALVHDPRCSSSMSPSTAWIRASACTCSNCCDTMAAQGRTVLLSSHILEEVERVADSVLVIYSGRLAAAGDFRSIRQLMTDRPHVFRLRSSDDRQLGSVLARGGLRLRRRTRRRRASSCARLTTDASPGGSRCVARERPASRCSNWHRPMTRSSRSSPTWWADDRARADRGHHAAGPARPATHLVDGAAGRRTGAHRRCVVVSLRQHHASPSASSTS